MPVIVLGNSSGAAPIDPTFDDGGVIQLTDTELQDVGAFHIIEQLITTGGGTVVTNSAAGSSTFTGGAENIHSPSLVPYISFSTEVIPTSTTTTTSNISASTSPSPSAPDAGPTDGDFTDESIYVSDATVLFTGGFSVESVIVQGASVVTSAPAGSSTFTQGDVASGTAQPPEQDLTVLSDDGMSAPVITTTTTTVLS